ncbi:MAG: hypothetical protein GNW80_08095 [Asgard group archaeon]|nr:hypothetical protein [Asgard group archaeon]
MKYEIKTYQESFLEDQYEVGKEAIKDWLFEAQTPVKSLRETYSQPGFDPTTRFYAFIDDKMIGYVLTRVLGEIDGVIKADLSYPRVLPGYEDAFDLLYEKAIEELKKRDAKVVRSIASKQWPNTIEAFEKLGFAYTSEVYRIFNLETGKFNIDDKLDMKGISEFNKETDFDDVVEFFVRTRGMKEERAMQVMDIIANVYPEEFFAHILLRSNNKIAARAVCTRMSDDTGNFYYFGDEDNFDNPIITKMIAVLKEKGIENVNAFLTKDTLSQEEKHLKLGFINYGEVSRYEKEI